MNNKATLFDSICLISFLFLLLLAFLECGLVWADTDLRYVPNKEQVKDIILENEHVKYTITIANTVMLSGAVLKLTGADLLADNPPLTFSSVRVRQWGSSIDDVGFQLFTLEESKLKNEVSVSIRQQSSYVENSAVVTQTFALGDGPELSWKSSALNSATGGRSYREPRTRTAHVRFPVMQKLKLGDPTDMHYLIPTFGGRFCIDNTDDFLFYWTRSYDPKMPVDIYNTRQDRGVYFHVIETSLDWEFKDSDDFNSRVFELTQGPGEESVIMDCRIRPHTGDWHAAFNAFKKHIRSTFDFTYYQRPVQEKYRQRLVSHFTFLYGLDIYNPETNAFDLNRFLDEGEQNFGGYDYMLLWHDYQRMGIDDRDQFAMYEDLPGGLAGLREMVNQAHARDVQVFLPYKPWDIMRKGQNHFTEEARVSKALGADGIFLDTMDDSDIAFREALDEVNPDNVFVSEGRPDLAAAQLVTGSWNQSGSATNRMPNVDLLRFILPEHNVHNINRAARKRDELVLNALFNGSGFIVWEDIFGEINKYTWNERILIQRYSRIIHENRDAYLTDKPIPLVANLRDDLYVNAFPIQTKCVYPAYQLGRENITRSKSNRLIGPFIEVDLPENWHYVDVWNHMVIPTDKKNGKTRLIFPEEPTDVMSCIVGMPKNLQVDKGEDVLRISAANPLEGAMLQINTVNNLTMMEEEVLSLAGNSGEVRLSDINPDFPYLVLVKLMQGGVMKDEVIVDLSWKRWE